MNKIKAILFNFSETPCWDLAYHDKAWVDFALKHASRRVSSEQMK